LRPAIARAGETFYDATKRKLLGRIGRATERANRSWRSHVAEQLCREVSQSRNLALVKEQPFQILDLLRVILRSQKT
jgi:hypothetical protein